MSGNASLTDALDNWIKKGGNLREFLPRGYPPVRSRAEAEVICAALDALRAEPERAGDSGIFSPIFTQAAFFQKVESREAYEFLRKDGLPRLRMWVRDLFRGHNVNVHSVMLILKILAMYRQHQDVALIAEAARKPIDPDNFMWSIVLGQFDADHPYATETVDALRDPLPTGFLLIAYLDMSNRLAIAGRLEEHPFNSESGRKKLEEWLRDTRKEKHSYARSATAALPFIDPSARDLLQRAAMNNPNAAVRMEAAWAQAKSGGSEGLQHLAVLCLDPRHSHTAQAYLKELGHADSIPAQALEPDFLAVAEMANWLAHPNEYGRPPDDIELLDTRELFWPPTNDKRRLWLVKYSYNADEDVDAGEGVGMVGSITFTLFGESTADLLPEDIYALHCCWELQMKEDPRSPEERSAQAGREILGRYNTDFG